MFCKHYQAHYLSLFSLSRRFLSTSACFCSYCFSSRGFAPPNILACCIEFAISLTGSLTVRGSNFNLGRSLALSVYNIQWHNLVIKQNFTLWLCYMYQLLVIYGKFDNVCQYLPSLGSGKLSYCIGGPLLSLLPPYLPPRPPSWRPLSW